MFKATWHSRPGSKPAFGTGLTALNCTQHLVSLQKNGTPQPSRPGLWRVTLQQDRSGKAGVSRQGQTLRGSLAPGKAQRATRFPAGHNFSTLEKPLGQVPSAELLPSPGLWPETLTAQNQGRGASLVGSVQRPVQGCWPPRITQHVSTGVPIAGAGRLRQSIFCIIK